MNEKDDRIDMHLMSVLDEQFNREDKSKDCAGNNYG